MNASQLAKLVADQFHLNTASKKPAFASTLESLSATPLVYEDSDLLDYAMTVVPLERLYSKADEDHNADPSFGEQDYVIKEMLKWFKEDFFTWVNNPICDICGGDTVAMGNAPPTEEEKKYGARHVEIYKCKTCSAIVRFARYNNPKKLLKTRRGRCGEWANCFTMLCRTLGSRARWVWNSEDHVWTEIYSAKQHRWIHIDSTEGAWDKPLIYQDGWGKKMAYCIGFSIEGAADVTRRYVRKADMALPRNKISEAGLFKELKSITNMRRASYSVGEREELEREDQEEEKELASYDKPKQASTSSSSEVGPRQSGAGEWTAERGEDGKK